METVPAAQSNGLKYDERFRTEVLYSIPLDHFIDLVMSEYHITRHKNKIKELLFYSDTSRLMNIRKTVDPDTFKWRGEELVIFLKGKYIQKMHYIILVDLVVRNLIPEGTYVITG